MPRFTSQVNVGENKNVTYKIATTTITDSDLGKPVKLTAADTVDLCADGDFIYGFINSIEVGTADGKPVVGVCVEGRVKVSLSGAVAIGAMVKAGANAAAGTAPTRWGIVKTHALDSASVAALITSTPKKIWIMISGAGTDGTDAIIEKQ